MSTTILGEAISRRSSHVEGAMALCVGAGGERQRELLGERGWESISLPLDLDRLRGLILGGRFRLIYALEAPSRRRAEIIRELRRLAAEDGLLVMATPTRNPYATFRLLWELSRGGWLPVAGGRWFALRAVFSRAVVICRAAR